MTRNPSAAMNTIMDGIDKMTRVSETKNDCTEISLQLFRPMTFYIRDHFGRDTVHTMARDCGLEAAQMLKGEGWHPIEKMEKFLRLARGVLKDEPTFRGACTYRLAEAVGPMRYILWAVSPKSVYTQFYRTPHLFSRFGTYRLLAEGRDWAHILYTSTHDEDRLLEILREEYIVRMPILWNLPPAKLEIVASQNQVNETIREYKVTWSAVDIMPIITGAIAGVMVALCAWVSIDLWPALFRHHYFVVSPVIGAIIGYVYNLRKIRRIHVAMSGQILTNVSVRSQCDNLASLLGMLKLMGSIDDEQLQTELYKSGVVEGQNIIDNLLRQGVVNEDDVFRARELCQNANDRSRAMDAVFEAVEINALRNRSQFEKFNELVTTVQAKFDS